MLSFFFSLWQGGQFTLEQCANACSRFGDPGPPYDPLGIIHIHFPLGAIYRQLFDEILDFPENLVIYGYPRITRLGYQQ